MIELVRRSIRIQTNLNEPDVEPFQEVISALNQQQINDYGNQVTRNASNKTEI